MKKVSLLIALIAFVFGNAFAQTVIINDDFEAYPLGGKIAQSAQELGIDWWTTWTNHPGGNEDGVVAEAGGTQCGYISGANDNVLLLGGQESGTYDLEFSIFCDEGKYGYFNILHEFNGGGSTWAMQAYVNATNNGQSTTTYSVGHGTVHAGENANGDIPGVVNEWMHFRIRVDCDLDIAELFYRTETTYPEEQLIVSWQWSLDSFGENVVGRKMDAMDFFAPHTTLGCYYLDNFKYTRIGEETAAALTFDTEAVNAWLMPDDITSTDIHISNAEGTSIGDWTGWIDFGESEGGTAVSQIYYDLDPGIEDGSNVTGVGLNIEDPTLVEVGAMFPGSAYAGTAMGAKIVSAQYPLFEWVDENQNNIGCGIEENTPLTFRVYAQGLNGQPGELLAEKVVPYNDIVLNDWTVATFDEPVVLSGFNVWVTCEFTQKVGNAYPFVFDGATPAEFGDYYRTNGGGAFNRCSVVFGTNEYGNFHIRANVQGTPVNGGWATLSKAEGSMPIAGEDMVTVNINSFGLSAGDVMTANIVFRTNDPENPEVIIPLTLTVDEDAVDESNQNTWSVYPNPATSMVTIEGENLSSVAIYNVAGQLVRVMKLDNMINNIDMNVEAGVYFFNVYDNNGNSTMQRVVITK